MRGGGRRIGAARGQVRIVGGVLRRTILPIVAARGLRPTPDRVRETLFNWLADRLEGARCLDLFAGTGVLGIEAASRGAARVVLNDLSPRALAPARELVGRLANSADPAARRSGQCIEIVSHDATRFLQRQTTGGERFDIVFLDPPFGRQLVSATLPLVADVLDPGGVVYVEAEVGADVLDGNPGWQIYRRGQAGQVSYYLLILAPASDVTTQTT